MADPIHILITGGHGQVGQALAHADWSDAVRLHRPTRVDLDLTSAAALEQAFSGTPFAAVINAAAFTAVDAAETQGGDAFLANALIPARLADATRRAGVPLIHLSTDCVFDGRLQRPYVEDDATAPISVYGASKRAGELATLAAAPRTAVVRTAWVFSARGRNFVRTILNLARTGNDISVVADRIGSPTSADDLARTLAALTTAMMQNPAGPTGVYHCVNAGEASWADLATEVVRLAGASSRIVPITGAEWPEPAARPANSRLSCERLANDYGLRLRPWREALADTVAQLKAEEVAP